MDGGGRISKSKVINSTIEGISSNSVAVGGIIGQQNWGPSGTYIKDSKVISKGINVGGIVGKSTTGISQVYAENVLVDGYANVGGIAGYVQAGAISVSYTNANVVATEHSAGGIVGHLNNEGMDNLNKISQIIKNYYAGGTIQGKEYVGGIIGEAVEELYMPETYYKLNYVDANLISENNNTTSLGVGNRHKSNEKLQKTCYYKYSKINGKYPTKESEPYIPNESYLVESELKQESTYKTKLGWDTSFNYEILNENKYPLIVYAGKILEGQDGINIPVDPVLEGNSENANNINAENGKQSLNEEHNEKLQYTFNYEGKIIKTYETYSEIIAEDGSKLIREDVRLYAKDGKLYALPIMIDFGNSAIKLVENNFIIDSYNGKEYETVLGTDGKIYDLKGKINYPENFVNKEIISIGNNLEDKEDNAKLLSEHEIAIVYKNGDKITFNYQTGEIISNKKVEEVENNSADTNLNKDSNLKAEPSKGLFEYIKERISEIGNANNEDITDIEMQNKYEETLKLENKLEETPVEEALQLQNSNVNKPEDSTDTENTETNNSLKEKKYISIYNAQKDDYQIYQEEELLDTSKQEVISENEKIETNKLNKYYASEVEAKNTKMGIVWIALSIIGVLTILIGIWGRT